MATFADRLRSMMGEAGLTQATFANIMGVSSASVGYWVRGDGTPPLETVERIAQHFRVSMDYMTGKSDYRTVEVPEENIIDDLNILLRTDLKRLPVAAQKEVAEYIKLQMLRFKKDK